MKEKIKKIKKDVRGITLIALVVTIAILAGGINGCAKIYSKRIKSKKVQI